MEGLVTIGVSLAAIFLTGLAVAGEDFLARGRPWRGGRPQVTRPAPCPGGIEIGPREVILASAPVLIRTVCRCTWREGDRVEVGLREVGDRQEVFCGRCEGTLAEVQEA